MIMVFDVSRYQSGLNFSAAYREGYRACYVKLGGDNVAPRYVSSTYTAQVDQARAAGLRVGSYWVPNGQLDPIGAADFFTANLRGWTPNDFAVLDDESLNAGVLFNDAQAAAWVKRVAANLNVSPATLFVYLGAADLRARTWPQLEALGVKLIVASYGKNTGVRDHEPNLAGRFGGVWAGHQYTSNATVGGTSPVDANLFQPWAFDNNIEVKENDMTPQELRTTIWYLGNPDKPDEVATVEQILQRIFSTALYSQRAAEAARVSAAEAAATVAEVKKLLAGLGTTPQTLAPGVASLLQVSVKNP